MEWYEIHNIDEVDSPALIVYPARVKENIRVLKAMVDEDVTRLRPHVKTHKTIEASRLLMAAGISKFKCATIAEAEMLAMAGAADVLLAYQPSGPKLQRFLLLIKNFPNTHFSCLTDNLNSAQNISEAAIAADAVVNVYIDVNVGMNRTGILPHFVLELYTTCTGLAGIILKGLHVYDGHIRDIDVEQRTRKSDEAFLNIERLRKTLVDQGFDKPVIIAGGSPTFPVHAKRSDVECSPGTFIFWDKGYLDYKEQSFVPAALVISRVISVLDNNTVCIDLGHKSIASENEPAKRIHFLNAPDLKFVSHSEEHLVMEGSNFYQLKVGDVLYGLPHHICPTVALYERALTVENNEVVGEWKIIARDRKITL